ncbi:MAG TPA: hypothetical protein VEW28_03620 [Candidatus Kapabacteria bacterium]|nr:hypothetical protein [Candidatus Kapabacteria bacterium]
MRHIIIILAIAAAGLLSSCKEYVTNITNAAQTSARHRLLFSPDTLRGIPFQYYAMKAAVSGVANSNMYLNWDVQGILPTTPHTHLDASKPLTDLAFTGSGKYKIVVSAYDSFSDSLITTDSTIANIDSVPPSVLISPASGNLFLFANTDSTVGETADIQTIIPLNPELFTFKYHIFGMRTDSTIVTSSNVLPYLFSEYGIYQVSVVVYDPLHNRYGSSMAYYNIVMPAVTPEMLAASKSIGVRLNVEYYSKTYDKLLYNSSVTGTLLCKNDVLFQSSFLPTGFVSSFNSLIVPNSGYSVWSHDSISGTFSADLKTLRSVSFSNHDTTTNNYSYRYWGVTLANAQLAYVTDSLIVYQIINVPSDNFVQNAYGFNSNSSSSIDIFIEAYELPPILNSLRYSNQASAFIVFHR